MDEPSRILLVEDDEAIAEMYRVRLMADGYNVEIACDSDQGLRRAIADPPDLVYLDLHVPRCGGLDLLRRLRAEPQGERVPVVILTNWDEPDLRARGERLGAVEYLIKSDTTPAWIAMETGRLLGSPPRDETSISD